MQSQREIENAYHFYQLYVPPILYKSVRIVHPVYIHYLLLVQRADGQKVNSMKAFLFQDIIKNCYARSIKRRSTPFNLLAKVNEKGTSDKLLRL